MSGIIRRNLKEARKCLDEEQLSAEATLESCLPVTAVELQQDQATAERYVVMLETRIAELECHDKEWQNFVAQLQDDKTIEKEEKDYEQSAYAENKGHRIILRKGRDQLGLMRVRLLNIKSALQTDSEKSQSDGAIAWSSKVQLAVKRPSLKLPSFDGDVMNWPNFWQRFQSAVDSTDGLTLDDKFNYLDGCLVGKGRIPIAGLQATGDNYELAVKFLKQQFELKPELMTIRLLRLLKQLRCQSGKVEDVQATYFEVNRFVRQLEDAGESMKGKSLVMDILNVFSPHAKWIIREIGTRLQIVAMVQRHTADAGLDDDGARSQSSVGGMIENLTSCSATEILSTLRDFLNDRATMDGLADSLDPGTGRKSSKPTSASSVLSANRAQNQRNNYDRNKEHVASSFSSTTAADDRSTKAPSPCIFCSGPHFHDECRKYGKYDERRRRVLELNACLRCLRKNHSSDTCRTENRHLYCYKCRQDGHRKALCPKLAEEASQSNVAMSTTDDVKPPAKSKSFTRIPKSKSSNQSPKPEKKTEEHGLIALMGTTDHSILSTALVTVQNPATGAFVKARLLFDSASSSSYFTSGLADKLCLKRSPSFLRTVSTFASENTKQAECAKVEAEILLKDTGSIRVIADTIDFITKASVTPMTLPETVQEMIRAMPYAMADNYETDSPPDILLGNDYFLSLFTGTPRLLDQQIDVVPTKLGLILGGTFSDFDVGPAKPMTLFTMSRKRQYDIVFESEIGDKRKDPDLEQFWRLEAIGITDNPKETSDELAEQRFRDTIRKVDNRWEVGWPFNEKFDLLSDNFSLAYGRLSSLARRLQQADPVVREEYAQVVDQQLKQGIIEEVPTTEIKAPSTPVHYLPHHAVLRVDHATTKVRVLYDASAKLNRQTVSLNECVHRGPVILPDLAKLLMKFRLNPVAVISHIEKAFLQISLRPQDRDVTRIL